MTNEARRRSNRIPVWDPGVRIFHWLLVASILIAFLSSEEDSLIANWHLSAGWVAAILIVFRLSWGFVGGEHARFANFVKPREIGGHIRELFSGSAKPSIGHNPLGAVAVLALLALCGLVGWTGIQLKTGGGGEEDLHEVAAYALLGLIALHVAAVIAMSIMTRDNLVLAMITGRKSAVSHPGATAAIKPGLVGIVLASLILCATVFAVLRFDPQAFSIQGRELGEANERHSSAEPMREHSDNDRDEIDASK